TLDGTPNKSRLGANALLSVSIAAMRLSALLEDIPLWRAIAKRAGTTPNAPCLFVNCMEGGVHAQTPILASREARPKGTMPNLVYGHADFKLPFQEYLLIVEGKTSEAFPIAQELFAKLGERLGNVPMGDEGGYAPTFDSLEKPLEILSSLVSEYPNTSIALDVAASELLKEDHYELLGKNYSPNELANVYQGLTLIFPIHSIEDPFAENAGDDFAKLTATIGGKVIIIGDDLTVTDPARIKDAEKNKEINAVIIKPNQIGTVREALQAVQETYAAGFKAVASHRSGETADSFIADFAYGIGAHGLKAGGFAQRERLVKYERLLAIEREAEAV
ncbi:MAG: phosphopyruvate hydratase, partial [bacterium]|nr:phosphopyruvate hydratase [bacterium]